MAEKRWTIPVCGRCGGMIGGFGTPCCDCPAHHAKTISHVRVIPASSPNVLSREEARGALTGSIALEALLRARESRHVSPPERGGEGWQCWRGDAEEDLAAVATALRAHLSEVEKETHD